MKRSAPAAADEHEYDQQGAVFPMEDDAEAPNVFIDASQQSGKRPSK